MNLRISHLFPLALIAAAGSCIAQTGTVTFYSSKPSAKDAVVPVGTVGFTGWLFDGDQRLAHAQMGRFMSFHLAAGEHQFTVPYHSNHPGKKSVLNLKVKSDGHYCVRLFAKYVSASLLLPISYVDSQIEQISCQQAIQEAGSNRPIDPKRVDPAVQIELDNSPSFPKDN
jgi:hypothetical protein